MHDTASTQSSLGRVAGLLALMRPRQWVKNGFVLAPLIFTGQFLDPASVRHALLATVLFCVASSATYIVNDLRDIERDRQHPKKSQTRPLAAGTVSPGVAVVLLGFLYLALICAWWVTPAVLGVIAVYLVLNLAYSFGLKHEPVVDIFTIAAGFVLRVYAGAMALNVPVSSWMFVTTLSLALFLAAVKRKQELASSGSAGRKVLERYTPALVNRYAEMSGTGALIFYSLFVMSSQPRMVISVPLVLFGLFRYWYVVEALDGGESPTDALLTDWQLLLTVFAWVGVCGWTLWPTAS